MPRFFLAQVACVFVCLVSQLHAQWDAPATYYDIADGVGSQLKGQLETAMTIGHIERRYGDFRFSASIHDQDPFNASNICLVYTESSVVSTWDSGVTWNREHVWPQSRQPGSASNSTRGNLGDPHALRPCNPSTNSSRGNQPFGFGDTTGPFGSLGTFWFPGDNGKGDIARSLFYSDTRWTSLGLSLTDGVPSGNQMGDLSSMIEWHFQDPPDEFERRRNHTIFSSEFNPDYFTNNRNAYIDRPEFVWSVYVDQHNDSMISIDGSQPVDGASALSIDFGAVIVGGQTSLDQSVQINKDGLDGTYYSIEAFDNAASEVTGRYNAFRMNELDGLIFDVSLDADNSTPGINVGFVVIDNLDVTTGGGPGRGANDGDDVIDMSLAVLDHSIPSFSATSDVESLMVDLGEVELGQEIVPFEFQVFNLGSPFGNALTARLDLFSIDVLPQDSEISVNGSTFQDLPAGDSESFSVTGTADELGEQNVVILLVLSDENIPGGTSETLQLSLTYNVVEAAFLLGDVNQDGTVNLLDIEGFVALLSSGEYQIEADINQDGSLNALDIEPFVVLLQN